MTHEELIAKIEVFIAEFCEDEKDFCDVCSPWKALRAVVEMHRPALDSEMDESSNNETLGCAGCGYDFNYGTWEVNYPCPTIQAIEKELK